MSSPTLDGLCEPSYVQGWYPKGCICVLLSLLFAVVLSSIVLRLLTLVSSSLQYGDHIVASSHLYGGTFSMLHDIFPVTHGINTTFVDAKDPNNFEKAITPRTRAVFIEALSNPDLDFVDVVAVAAIAHKHKLPLIVDSTFTPPSIFQPLKHGADIVVHSLTKWIGGHGAAIGGVVVDSGKFNWKDEKFTLFTQPDTGYHNLRWGYDLPAPLAPIGFALRLRLNPLRSVYHLVSYVCLS